MANPHRKFWEKYTIRVDVDLPSSQWKEFAMRYSPIETVLEIGGFHRHLSQIEDTLIQLVGQRIENASRRRVGSRKVRISVPLSPEVWESVRKKFPDVVGCVFIKTTSLERIMR